MSKTKKESIDENINALLADIKKLKMYTGIDVTKDYSKPGVCESEINQIKEQLDYTRQALIMISACLVALNSDE